MADIRQRMLDHMNEHWSGEPPLEGQVEAGRELESQSPYAQWVSGHHRDLGIALELLGEDLMWDNDNNRWIMSQGDQDA